MNHEIYRSISETAEELDLPQHVLRFWETKFSQIKPTKRESGQKFYRSTDLELLHGIRHLLYEEGHTIKGVQKLLEEHGVDWVISLKRQESHSQQQNFDNSEEELSRQNGSNDSTFTRKKKTIPTIETDHIVEEAQEQPSLSIDNSKPEVTPKDVLTEVAEKDSTEKSALSFLPLNRGQSTRTRRNKKGTGLTKDEIKRLNGALSELLECKRLLDQASN